MKKPTQNDLLDQKIALLIAQQQQELVAMKLQFGIVKESISPVNIIQEGIHGVVQTVTNKNKLLPTILSLLGGYVSRKVIVGGSSNPIKKIVGTVLQLVVTNYLTKLNSNDETADTQHYQPNITK